MTRSYWLVNSNRSRVKGLSKIQKIKINYLNICFWFWEWYFYIEERTTFNNNQKRIKLRCSPRRMEKINCLRLEKNRVRLDKKRELWLLILNRWSNNTQLLTNSCASSKLFILFKLFLPKSKSINLSILLAN